LRYYDEAAKISTARDHFGRVILSGAAAPLRMTDLPKVMMVAGEDP
jgi:hypothetical protein